MKVHWSIHLRNALFGVAAALLILSAGYFIFVQLYFTKDVLVKYVPADVGLYVHGETQELARLPFILDPIPLKSLQRITESYPTSIALVPVQDEYKPLFVFSLPDEITAENTLQEYTNLYGLYARHINNNFLERYIYVMSTDKAVLDRVSDVLAQREDSLSDKIEKIFALHAASQNTSVVGYATDALMKSDGSDSFFPVRGMWDTFSVHFTGNGGEIMFKSTPKAQNHPRLISALPQKTTMYLRTYNPASFIDTLIERILSDASLSTDLQKVQRALEHIYSTDITLIQQALNGSFEYLKTEDDEVILAIRPEHLKSDFYSDLLAGIREYIRVQDPVEREYMLRDGSLGREIIKNPNSSTDSYVRNGLEIQQIATEGKSLYITKSTDVYFISTSKELLHFVVLPTNTVPLELQTACADGDEILGFRKGGFSQLDSFLEENSFYLTSISQETGTKLCF